MTLRNLANFFDVSVDYLIGNDIGNPDTVELCNFLSCGSYTLDGRFPTAGDQTMLHNIVKTIEFHNQFQLWSPLWSPKIQKKLQQNAGTLTIV